MIDPLLQQRAIETLVAAPADVPQMIVITGDRNSFCIASSIGDLKAIRNLLEVCRAAVLEDEIETYTEAQA